MSMDTFNGPIPLTLPNGREASVDQMLAALIAEANGDEYRLLHLLDEHLSEIGRHADATRDLRLSIARELRTSGANMQDVADAAGVTSSYLTRLILAEGDKPRVSRRRTT